MRHGFRLNPDDPDDPWVFRVHFLDFGTDPANDDLAQVGPPIDPCGIDERTLWWAGVFPDAEAERGEESQPPRKTRPPR